MMYFKFREAKSGRAADIRLSSVTSCNSPFALSYRSGI